MILVIGVRFFKWVIIFRFGIKFITGGFLESARDELWIISWLIFVKNGNFLISGHWLNFGI